MEQLRIIYRILRTLQKAMDTEEFEKELISPETLGISRTLWSKLMKMLVKEGYIEGVRVIEPDGQPAVVKMARPEITLRGLEYLEENSIMKKAAGIAKGIREIMPL